jgi:hypothetical protein
VSLTRRLPRRALTLSLARKSGRNSFCSLFGGRRDLSLRPLGLPLQQTQGNCA